MNTPATDPAKPGWLKIRPPSTTVYPQTRGLLEHHRLHTVCREAQCPNQAECWENRTVTFMISHGCRCRR